MEQYFIRFTDGGKIHQVEGACKERALARRSYQQRQTGISDRKWPVWVGGAEGFRDRL